MKTDKLVWSKLCKDFVYTMEEEIINEDLDLHYRKYPKSPKGVPL